MSKHEVTVTADGTYKVAQAYSATRGNMYKATVYAYDTWGGGVLDWYWSPDGGTTKISLKDLSGVAVSMTANDGINIEFGRGDRSNDIEIYATLTGSTTPSLRLGVFDLN